MKYLAIVIGLLLLPNYIMPAKTTCIDINLPTDTGIIAVRIFPPSYPCYPDGSPIIIYVPGADSPGGLRDYLSAEDFIVITFLFPGGRDGHRYSDGTYDHRGMNCIKALRDVILYAHGGLCDDKGRKIDDVLPVKVLHENIGLVGVSNGGNIAVAVCAFYELPVKYIVQWESPVSSQIATVDLGPIRFNCSPNNFVNPRYIAYGPLILQVDYSDLTYHNGMVFHDGNGDGRYTTIIDPSTGLPTPDLDLDGILELNEDFPLSSYTDGIKKVYSRPVTHALANVISAWPPDIATPEEADAYWDLREAVRLYDDALIKNPDLKGMVIATVKDHVQSAPDKPHIHQAFDGWNITWVKINPSPSYLIETDPSLAGRKDLPNNKPNIPPKNWSIYDYCIPEDIPDVVAQVAAIREMADRVYYNKWYNLKIDVEGGIGLSIKIKNIGKSEANITWQIDFEGFVIGKHKEGRLNILPGEEATIKAYVIGFGSVNATIKIGEEIETFDCLLIGPIVLINNLY